MASEDPPGSGSAGPCASKGPTPSDRRPPPPHLVLDYQGARKEGKYSRTSRGSQRGQSEETPPEGEAVRRSCGPEEDSVVRASRWCGHLKEAIEEEEEEVASYKLMRKARGLDPGSGQPSPANRTRFFIYM